MNFSYLKKNVFSQNGEDGIIEYLLDKIVSKDGWCCEFGAWDGKHLSNTFNLIVNKNYKGVYIEGDSEKFKDLLETSKQYTGILPKNKWVYPDGVNSLDNILSETEIPINFDLLSIDVDGIDYLIWEKLERYNPKIVVIEINSSFEPSILFTDEELSFENLSKRAGLANGGVNFETCYKLGRKKGYRLFTHTGNMIFIHEEHSDIFEELANDENYLSYYYSVWKLMSGYSRP